ncbi:Armadillo-like helical [Penicillium angulare]|uniref:Armadillo-like helical n=1 Tax=Penicillium angulare TaxID=116970 RepID=A0A9W9F437_9EURO|nr:Armadillo-like helical [Penicillium angulare]
MAFKHGLSERLDELRFPSPRSPPSESTFPGYSSLSPGHSNFVSGFSRPASDVRANLQRRFTTDSSKFSSWNNLNQAPAQAADPLDLLSSFEKKRQHIEYMREQKRRFEEDMKLLDIQHEQERIEMDQIARDLAKAGLSGPASEPTTPPEYREPAAVSSAVSRPSRFSVSSVTSSPGFFNAFAPSSTLTSPQAPSQPNHAHAQSFDRFAGHSLPGSRRNSEKEEFLMEPSTKNGSLRPNQSLHRYSLPASNYNGHHRPNLSGYNVGAGLDSFAAAKNLFHGDEKPMLMKDEDRISTPDIKSYIRMTEPDDKFPTLRRGGSNILSANPDALDLANSRTPGPESYRSHDRYGSSHQSMPQNYTGLMRMDQMGGQTNERNLSHSHHHPRRSLESGFIFQQNERSAESMTPVPASTRPSSLQSSYSTNDLPTVKGSGFDAAITPPKTNNNSLHQHNTSMGRIPAGAAHAAHPHQSRHSPESENQNRHSPQTMLQANAAPFGPQLASQIHNGGISGSNVSSNIPFPAYNYGGMPSYGQTGFPAANGYGAYSNYPTNGYRANEPATRVAGQRRGTEGDASQMNRFTNFPLEHYKGDLYELCKDQHGCRYLQRKLEERNPEHVQLIFSETYMHVTELMTDPFGNYLCQKLLEFSNDEQRTALINNAAPQLVTIAFNQHGTRALQKMIEFISTPEQTQTVINALKYHVVQLVQDLNGNHVIQKCLNRLSSEDADFIYKAVGENCVQVGSHRHGCCVLQRCIDHASGAQRARLIGQVIRNAFPLVQDPFGNYVIQYILDLKNDEFTLPLCELFTGSIVTLSKNKFSSNVVEKCLKDDDVAPVIKHGMIEEMFPNNEVEKMLRDSYANYVLQTALDKAQVDQRKKLVDIIRLVLPSIRQTPHGRRISGKLMLLDTHPMPSHGDKSLLASPRTNGFSAHNLPPTPATSSTANTPPSGPESASMFGTPISPPGGPNATPGQPHNNHNNYF